VAQEVGQRLGEREVLFGKVQALKNSDSFERILLIPFDHLNLERGVLKTANSKTDLILFVQSERMTSGRNWHKERLFFLISSAKHFAKKLEDMGFTVWFIEAPTTIEGISQAKVKLGELPVICAEPSSFKQYTQLKEAGVEFVQNDFFLTSRGLFRDWADSQKTFVMENFYRAQRVRLGILVKNGKPEQDRWNFDAENRLPPPKNYTWPERLAQERDEIDLAVSKTLGYEPTDSWATTREGALRQLDHFLEHHLAGFGPYEDAVTLDEWSLHHSLLSPYLNNGLITAAEVVAAAVRKYELGAAPIESVEAFVRQIIGWREYINGMYWFLGADYQKLNGLNAERKLLPLFHDSSKTKMNCVSKVVEQVETRAWTHHIPRLMILSNLALVTGTNPQEFLDWMRENFVDATQWVMVPNIIGMGVHADSGKLMTKPYAAGGAYINRMTQYCKGCVYDPKKRAGEDACPFTTLYWDFLDRHKDEFKKNHRMSQQVFGLNRLSDLPELRVRAQEVLEGLAKGLV
jgi:deoxyribodipyrimidine photolyase-related protein